MRRGDVVLIAMGKPRPAVIVQDDQFETPVDVIVCPFTTTIINAPIYRIDVPVIPGNGLQASSQLMVDRIGPARRDRIDKVVGRLSDDEMGRLTDAMAVMLGVGR